jgi:hypothetical protein
MDKDGHLHLFALDRFLQPRGEKNIGSAGCRACVVARAGGASPIIFGRVDGAGANRGFVEGTDVTNANVAGAEVVEVNVDLGGSVDSNVDIFIPNFVMRNDGATNRRATITTVDVDSYPAGSSI